MGFADYYDRSATAASHVVAGFDAEAFKATLSSTKVGISFGRSAATSLEGRALVDMTVRLLARFYPVLHVIADGADDHRHDVEELARRINPSIELSSDPAAAGVAVGADAPLGFGTPVFAGSSGWDARVSSNARVGVAASRNPLGPGAAACLAAARLFNHVLLGAAPDSDVVFSTFDRAPAQTAASVPNEGWELADDTVLVGVGAIGNSTVWALSRAPARGRVHLVDDQTVEVSNIQRYVLAERAHEGAVKVQLAADQFDGDAVKARAWPLTWEAFLEQAGYAWPLAVSALDTARHRRAVQAALPQRVVNAWTQPGDLGLSVHSEFGGDGACLWCLYLPSGAAPNEDELVARALGVPHLVSDVRTLLYTGGPVQPPFLQAVAAGLDISPEAVLPFTGRPVRALYVEGVCGGAVLPLGRAGAPHGDVHVPLAHQSALAGVLLAAASVRMSLCGAPDVTEVTRLNVLSHVGAYPTQPARRDPDAGCICADADYVDAHRRKYDPPACQPGRQVAAGAR